MRALVFLLAATIPLLTTASVRRRRREGADDRSLCSGEVHGAGDRRPERTDLRARARAGGTRCGRRPSPTASCCSFTAPARPPKSPSTCRIRTTAGWRYLARAGFDVFSMDTTGYGRSTRPGADERSVQPGGGRQAPFVEPRRARRAIRTQLTTIASDWDDIGAAVDYVRALRRVDRGEPDRVVARRTARGRIRRRSTPRRCAGSCCSRQPTTEGRRRARRQDSR